MRLSVQALSIGFYSGEQIRSAVACIAIPDQMLIEDGHFKVAVADGQIIGCGGWSERKKSHTGSDSSEDDREFVDPMHGAAKIRAFFVDPGYAGSGVGRAIYEACETEIARAGFRRVELMATLPGVPFYLRLGFRPGASTQLRLTDGTLLASLVMTKDLAPSEPERG